MCIFILQLRVQEKADKRKGSACFLQLLCQQCGIVSEQYASFCKDARAGHDINKRLVTAAAMAGIGYTQLCQFFATLNLPKPMHKSTWHSKQLDVHKGVVRAADKHLELAATEVRRAYEVLGHMPDSDGILNIAVSYDGSWHTRGFRSHTGIASVIEVVTGLVLDYITMSNYCHGCELGPKPTDPHYTEWEAAHQPDCQKDVTCSSGAMETKGATILWSRSIDLHKFRYIEMLSDGDAKSYNALVKSNIYDGIDITKIECTNHVAKRMGTALRNCVAAQRAIKKPISGKGKLTDTRIKELTRYYGTAIKSNVADLEGMESAVWASFFHTFSSKEEPHHNLCPTGSSSWCHWQRANSTGTEPDYSKHSKPLPKELLPILKPIYKRLGDPELLKRCLSGKTSNNNESFHSTVWKMCPKHRWVSARTIDTAVGLCVQKFNQGTNTMPQVLLELDMVAGKHLEEFVQQADKQRIASAEYRANEKTKRRRLAIDQAKSRAHTNLIESEGVSYGPGQF